MAVRHMPAGLLSWSERRWEPVERAEQTSFFTMDTIVIYMRLHEGFVRSQSALRSSIKGQKSKEAISIFCDLCQLSKICSGSSQNWAGSTSFYPNYFAARY